jgi:hypothetical protein
MADAPAHNLVRLRQQYPAVFDTVTASATHRLFKHEMMIIEMGS